jgi:hypothetical protein
MSLLPAPLTLVERLTGIIAMVRQRLDDWRFRVSAPNAAAAAPAAGSPDRMEVRNLIHRRFQRIGTAFAALLARFRAGTLLPPRAAFRRRAAAGPRKPPDPAAAGLPRCFGWFVEMAGGPDDIGPALPPLLEEPEMRALEAAAPGPMRRLFRPVCWALGVHLPQALQAPRAAEARPRALPMRPSVREALRAGHRFHLAWVKAQQALAGSGVSPAPPPRADETVGARGRRPTPGFLPPLGLPNFGR